MTGVLILARARRACNHAKRVVEKLIHAEYLPDAEILYEWNIRRLKRVKSYATFITWYEDVCAFVRVGAEGSIIPVRRDAYLAYAQRGRRVERVMLTRDVLERFERLVNELERAMNV